MRTGLATLLTLLLAGAVRADERVAPVTNRLAQIIATSNYTFSVLFGRQGALEINGYATPTSSAFVAKLSGHETLRYVDGSFWLPGSATGEAVTVSIAFPLHLYSVYLPSHVARLGFSVLPPSQWQSFVVAGYGGLATRIDQLPFVKELSGGWQFCETNEVGTCVEVTSGAEPLRAGVALLKTEADKSSVFIHELRLAAGGPTARLSIPPARRTVKLDDFVVALTFCTDVSSVLLHAASSGGSPEDVATRVFAHMKRAEEGRAVVLPPLPMLPPGAGPRN